MPKKNNLEEELNFNPPTIWSIFCQLLL